MVRSRFAGRLSLLLLSFVAVLLIFPAMAFAQTTAPTIQSDLPDYAPGDTVTLTGSNWQPGEVVHINVNDNQTQPWSRDVDVTADANGNITDQFQLPTTFAALYNVTATGPISGTATTTFTDGNKRFRSVSLSDSGNVVFPITYTKYTASSTCGSGANTTGTGTVSQNAGGTFQQDVASGQSIKLTAPLSEDGQTFADWTGVAGSTFTTSGTKGETICVSGSNPQETFDANYTTDLTAPTVVSINRVGSSPTNTTGNVQWTVTFSEDVTGVDASDFSLVKSGLGGTPTITNVSGNNATRTVTASIGSGEGTLGLNLVDNDTIIDVTGHNKLGGKDANGNPIANGDFTGQVYTFDRTAPTVVSINRFAPADSHTNTTGNVLWTVTFSENVSGVNNPGDFQLANPGGGLPGTAVTGVNPPSGPSATYTVSAHPGSGEGTLRLDLVDDDSITDGATNKLGGTGTTTTGNGSFTTGQTYTFDRTRPTVTEVVPTEDANNVAVGTNVTAKFSEDMKATTINSSNFDLRLGTLAGSVVSGSAVNYDSSSRTATLDPFANDPSANLLYAQEYTALLNNEVRDLAGNRLMTCVRCPIELPREGKWWSFFTEPPPDAVAPTTDATASKATTPTPTPYNSGDWSNKNVTVNLSASDNDGGSGVKNLVYSAEGADPISTPVTDTTAPFEASLVIDAEGVTEISFRAEDKNGNIEDPQTFTVKLDKTAPKVTYDDNGTPVNANFNDTTWRKTSLSKQFTASDANGTLDVSGIDLANSSPVLSSTSFTLTASDESVKNLDDTFKPTTVSQTVKDVAGNETERSLSALIDKTNPSVSAQLNKTAVNGWFNLATGAPTVSFLCSDALSGLATTCPSPHLFPEGADQSRSSGNIFDIAGNFNSAGVSGINVDLTRPTTTLDPGGPSGWINTVSGQSFIWGGSDNLSTLTGNPKFSYRLDGGDWSTPSTSTMVSLATLVGSGTLSQGSHTFEVKAVDLAGNEDLTVESRNFSFDNVKPTITLTKPASGDSYTVGEPVTANYTCSDNGAPLTGSGVASCLGKQGTESVPNGDPIDTDFTAPKSFTVDATDVAGNTATVTNNFGISYLFVGWFQPVDGDGLASGEDSAVNMGKVGRTYPIKWQLKEYANGVLQPISDTTAQNLITSAPMTSGLKTVTCGAWSTLEADILEDYTTGSTSLRYDATSDQFIYNYKAPSNPQCQAFLIYKADGVNTKQANFKFTK